MFFFCSQNFSIRTRSTSTCILHRPHYRRKSRPSSSLIPDMAALSVATFISTRPACISTWNTNAKKRNSFSAGTATKSLRERAICRITVNSCTTWTCRTQPWIRFQQRPVPLPFRLLRQRLSHEMWRISHPSRKFLFEKKKRRSGLQ